MIGVIIVPGLSTEMHGLDAKRSLALLPLGDRPILQHVVESLVAQGITSIELIVGHAPETVEALLGNGDRWGCKFRYHLAVQADRPYRSLKIIPEIKTNAWCLIHAESYPYLEFPSSAVSKPVVFYGSSVESSEDGYPKKNGVDRWKGTAIFPSGVPDDIFVGQTVEEFYSQIHVMAVNSEADVVNVDTWLDASSPAALLKSQTMLLERQMNNLMISGTEREPGIWISRNVVIHPSVELTAPLYVGPNSRLNRGVKLGPNTVIEGECIVDTNTIILNSVVTAGSYVGEGLELDQTLVDHNLLINTRLGTSVNIAESFLLGGLKRQRRQNWFVQITQSLLAVILILIFLPVFLLSLIFFAFVKRISYASVSVVQLPAKEDDLDSRTYELSSLGKDAWSLQRKAGWSAFTRQFLPGLPAVVRGHIGLVGFPPRSATEIAGLSSDWRELYLSGNAGLITEAGLALSDSDDATQLYLADAYYSVKRGFLYNAKLAAKYFLRLVVPV